MSQHLASIHDLLAEVARGVVPESVATLVERLEPLTIDLRQSVPTLGTGARLFRVRVLPNKPTHISEVGAPPSGVAPIGRLNDEGESVLYLSDSPDTAFAEVGATNGHYCLSEWRIEPPKVALANGGIPLTLLQEHFPGQQAPPGTMLGGTEDKSVLALFQALFTLSVESDRRLYRWSIASGLVNGFAAKCGRTSVEVIEGNTRFTGRYPLSGIAYPSIRKDKQAINFGFNDLGVKYLRLNNVQWVERHPDGHFSGLDFASDCSSSGNISWHGRPAHYQLPPGAEAQLTKVSEDVWNYEQKDGGLPYFV